LNRSRRATGERVWCSCALKTSTS